MPIATPLITPGEAATITESLQKITLISCERGARVHVVVGEHPDGFHLGVVEQVRLIDDHDGAASVFGVLGGEGVGGPRGTRVAVEKLGTAPSAVTMWCSMPRTPTEGLGG
jgi:hypothetical protein